MSLFRILALYKDKQNRLLFLSSENFMMLVDRYAPVQTDNPKLGYHLYGHTYGTVGAMSVIDFYKRCTIGFANIVMKMTFEQNQEWLSHSYSKAIWWRKLLAYIGFDIDPYTLMLKGGRVYLTGVCQMNQKIPVPPEMFDYMERVDNVEDLYTNIADIWKRSHIAPSQGESSVSEQPGP